MKNRWHTYIYTYVHILDYGKGVYKSIKYCFKTGYVNMIQTRKECAKGKVNKNLHKYDSKNSMSCSFSDSVRSGGTLDAMLFF